MPLIGPARRMRRRRVVATAAVVGGAAYYAGKKGAQAGQNEAEEEYAEPEAQGETEPDYTEELEHLAKLHEQGVLTDDEFAAKKKEVLGI
jgi:uncharacterized protein YdgA (DUF945 family)